MFMLYGLVVGGVVGWATGGRLAALAHLRLAWAPLIATGLIVQVALFSGPIAASVGELGPPIYLASSVVVFIGVLRNVRVPLLALVAAGAACNLAAIAANGGYMPASPDALAAIGGHAYEGYSNSMPMAEPSLAILTDIFALPAAIPFANVFSIGDVLITVGLAVTVAFAMRSTPSKSGGPDSRPSAAAEAGGGAPAH